MEMTDAQFQSLYGAWQLLSPHSACELLAGLRW